MKNLTYIFLLLAVNLFAQEEKVQTSQEYQDELNISFADSIHSPLNNEDRLHFEKLDFFPIDEKFIVKAKFVKLKRQKPFEMPTTTARKPKYIKYGELHFTIENKTQKLTVYKMIVHNKSGIDDNLFLPFLDETNGIETYGGGRYLDMKTPKTKEVTIDFNKAYNPYCAYNHEYSCPIVPLENELTVKINAGVKKFHE